MTTATLFAVTPELTVTAQRRVHFTRAMLAALDRDTVQGGQVTPGEPVAARIRDTWRKGVLIEFTGHQWARIEFITPTALAAALRRFTIGRGCSLPHEDYPAWVGRTTLEQLGDPERARARFEAAYVEQAVFRAVPQYWAALATVTRKTVPRRTLRGLARPGRDGRDETRPGPPVSVTGHRDNRERDAGQRECPAGSRRENRE